VKVINRIIEIFKIKSLSKRLWIFTTILLTVLVFVTIMYSYYSAASAMQDGAISFSKEILDIKAQSIDNYIEYMDQYSLDILYEPAIYDILASAEELDKEEEFVEREINQILQNQGVPIMELFKKTMIARKEIQAIALLDNDGLVWVYDNDDAKKIEIQVLIDEKMFAGLSEIAMQAQGKQDIYLHVEDGTTTNIFFIRSVYSQDNYEQLGHLVFLADKDYFGDIIASNIKENAFSVILYSDDGTPVHISEEADLLKATDEFLKKKIVWQVNNWKNMLFVRADVKNVNWSLVSMQKLDILFADIHNFRTILIISAFIMSFVFSVLSWIFARDTLKPIKSITNAMERVRSGETEVDVEVDREDELGYMSATFNTMVKENQTLVRDIYRAEITKKDAELQALQSQINPHFLFNTLETISWTARLKDVDEISEMVDDMAEIMKAGIGKGESLIELEMEIEYIDRYLRIMKKRFADRLHVIKRIDPSLYSYKIPKLLIQPLIENAIYHGIDKRRKGGSIFVGASEKRNKILIIVCNTGKGMEQADVNAINANLNRTSDEYFFNLNENQKSNVGLENVNRRIKLYFGEEYGIRIESKVGHYTKVVAMLPKESIKEGEKSV